MYSPRRGSKRIPQITKIQQYSDLIGYAMVFPFSYANSMWKHPRCIWTCPRLVLKGTGAGKWSLRLRDRKLGFRCCWSVSECEMSKSELRIIHENVWVEALQWFRRFTYPQAQPKRYCIHCVLEWRLRCKAVQLFWRKDKQVRTMHRHSLRNTAFIVSQEWRLRCEAVQWFRMKDRQVRTMRRRSRRSTVVIVSHEWRLRCKAMQWCRKKDKQVRTMRRRSRISTASKVF